MNNPGATRFEGFVLRREPAGERHLRLVILDASLGLVHCLYKPVSKSGAAMVTPDLFDLAEVFPDPPKSGDSMRFVREYRLLRRHAGLGADYGRLAIACRFANLLAKNPHPPESWAALYTLTEGAIEAFAEKPYPEVAYFKSLWRIARDEGLPVREDFLPKLREGESRLVAFLLSSPLSALNDEIAAKPLIEGLSRSLELWLEREAHYVIG